MIAAVVVAIVILGRVRGVGGVWPDFCEGVMRPLAFPPFVVLVVLALLAGLIYIPTMLDSLTYRLPRIWLWLQDHHIHSYGAAIARIDYMPQTWELATLPWVQAFGDKLAWFWTFCSWLVFYLVVYDWSWGLSGSHRKSQYFAFFASATPFAVLQATATANDLFAATALLLALHFIGNVERSRDGRDIGWALLSFTLACGTKTHYAIFGLPLLLWFFGAPSRPWRIFPWKWFIPLIAICLLCSPVPSFVINQRTSGVWLGSDYNRIKGIGGPVWNVAAGMTMLLWQTPQPPVNPAALLWKKRLEDFGAKSVVKKNVPRFTLGIPPVSLPDGAGLGLVASVLMAAGALLAFRHRLVKLKSLAGWAALSGLILLIVAVSQYVPGGVARTYTGFILLTLPMVIVGWNLLGERALRWSMWLSLLTAVTALVLEPSRPLWPAQSIRQAMQNSPRFAAWATKLDSYFLVPERAHAGEALVRAMPETEPQVLLLVGDDWPVLPMFQPYGLKRKVIMMPLHSSPQKIEELGINYVIVGGGGSAFYPELYEYLTNEPNLFELVMTRNYTCKLMRGPEPWTLYRRIGYPQSSPGLQPDQK